MLTILSCLMLAALAFGQWDMVKGPVDITSPNDAVALNATTVLAIYDDTVKKSTDLGANWTELMLSEGVSMTAIDAANENVAYACGKKGYVFKTIDGGDNWTQVGDTAKYKIDMFVIDVLDENTVFIGGGFKENKITTGIFFKTTDGGTNWDTTLVYNQILNGGVAFTDANNGVAFDNGVGGIIHTTHDGGDNWVEYPVTLPLGVTSKRMYVASAVPGTSTILVAGYHNVIWHSTDKGDTWTCANPYDISYGFDRMTGLKAFDANNWLGFSSGSEILKTTDAGTTWDTLTIGSAQSYKAKAFSSMTNGIIWAASGQEFSTTDGSTFVPLNEWPSLSLYGIAFPAEDKIFITSTNGGEVIMSDDNGMTFSYPSNVPTGFKSSIYKTEFISENVGLIGGGSGYIGKTLDGGATFTTIPTPMAEESNKHINMMHLAPNGDVFAGGSSGLVMKSTDNGDTWEMVSTGATQTVYDMCVFSNGMAMLGQGSGQFSVSASTALDSFVMVADYGAQSFRSIDEREGVVLVAGSGGVYKTTTDALDTLDHVFSEPDGKNMYCISFINDTIVYTAGDLGLVYRSDDAGETWEQVPTDANKTIQGLRYDGHKLWAVGQEGVIMSLKIGHQVTANVDMGIMVRRGEFNPATSGLDIIGSFDGWTGTPMTDTDGDTVYTASLGWHIPGTKIEFKCRRNGAWDNTEEFPSGGANRTYLVTDTGDQTIPTFLYGDITEVPVGVEGLPTVYALAQNYPNPFNPSTTIKFQIPNTEMVTMNIFDLKGHKVAELFNTQMDAGFYNVTFDASALPSGMYIYRLTAGEFKDIKKMTLLK